MAQGAVMVKWQKKILQMNSMAKSLAAHRLNEEDFLKVANATISVCGKSRHWEWSLHLVISMQSMQSAQRQTTNGLVFPAPDVISYGTAISVLGRVAQWQRALLLLGHCDMMGKQKRLKGIEVPEQIPDLICFNSALSACGQGLQWLQANALVSRMMEREVRPDAVSISTLVNTFGKVMRWQLALWHFFALPTVSSVCQSHRFHRRICYDVLTLSSAISACEKGRKWQAALILLTEAMTGLICTGSRSKSETPSESSVSMQLPSFFPDAICFSAAIVACEGCSQWERSLHLLDQMSFWSSPNVTCHAITLKAMSAARRWQHAIALLRSPIFSKEHGLNGFAWASLFSACSTAKQEKLCTVLQALLKALSENSRLRLRPGFELAELLCIVRWLRALGVSDSSASAKFLRSKASWNVHALSFDCRHPAVGLKHLSDLDAFAGDVLECQGFRTIKEFAHSQPKKA